MAAASAEACCSSSEETGSLPPRLQDATSSPAAREKQPGRCVASGLVRTPAKRSSERHRATASAGAISPDSSAA